jgi:hypothetical protein
MMTTLPGQSRMDMQPPVEPDADESMEGLIPVPLDSLAQPDEGEKMQAPGEGDAITMQVEATVTKIDGSTAYIKPTAINGKQLDAAPDTDEETDQGPPPEQQPAGLSDALKQNGGFPQ